MVKIVETNPLLILEKLNIDTSLGPDKIVDQLHSMKDRISLETTLREHKIKPEDFWAQILNINSTGIEDKPVPQVGKQLKYDIMMYDPRQHDITDLSLMFEEEVIGGERSEEERYNINHDNFLVAVERDSNNVRGYISYYITERKDLAYYFGKRMHLDELMVDKEYRKRSIGHKLHSRMVEIARNYENIDCITTHAHNFAVDFFRMNNYKNLGHCWQNDYSELFHDMVLPVTEEGMEKITEASRIIENIGNIEE